MKKFKIKCWISRGKGASNCCGVTKSGPGLACFEEFWKSWSKFGCMFGSPPIWWDGDGLPTRLLDFSVEVFPHNKFVMCSMFAACVWASVAVFCAHKLQKIISEKKTVCEHKNNNWGRNTCKERSLVYLFSDNIILELRMECEKSWLVQTENCHSTL